MNGVQVRYYKWVSPTCNTLGITPYLYTSWLHKRIHCSRRLKNQKFSLAAKKKALKFEKCFFLVEKNCTKAFEIQNIRN